MTQFPSDPDEITPALLSEALDKHFPGIVVERVDRQATKFAGQGVASTADRVILDLVYAPGAPAEAPSRMVLKTMLISPHAPPTMYENEVRFYDEIRPHLEVEAPRAFGCHFTPETGNFGLLLEDLGERGARFPDATQPTTLGEIESLLDQLATVHARFWQSPRLATDLAWVPTPIRGGMADLFNEYGQELIQSQLDQHAFKRELIAPLGRSFAELWEALCRARTQQAREPATLLHGDPHIGNTYLLPGETGGLLDWQLVTRGCFAHDVTYLLATGLPPETRREHQERLVRHYLARLQARGVSDAPDFDSAWFRCRRAALWGLVIGWLITPPANYGVEITGENIRRTVLAVQDLDALGAIG